MNTTLVTICCLALAACGSRSHGDTYARGTNLQQQCCESLAGSARDRCLSDIVRVDDKAVVSSSANQQTYACVVDHFTCDAATGHATQASAQQQLECIQEL